MRGWLQTSRSGSLVSPWARTSILLPTQRPMHRALHKPKLPESRAVLLGTGDTHLVPPEPHKPPSHPKIPPQIHPPSAVPIPISPNPLQLLRPSSGSEAKIANSTFSAPFCLAEKGENSTSCDAKNYRSDSPLGPPVSSVSHRKISSIYLYIYI